MADANLQTWDHMLAQFYLFSRSCHLKASKKNVSTLEIEELFRFLCCRKQMYPNSHKSSAITFTFDPNVLWSTEFSVSTRIQPASGWAQRLAEIFATTLPSLIKKKRNKVTNNCIFVYCGGSKTQNKVKQN